MLQLDQEIYILTQMYSRCTNAVEIRQSVTKSDDVLQEEEPTEHLCHNNLISSRGLRRLLDLFRLMCRADLSMACFLSIET